MNKTSPSVPSDHPAMHPARGLRTMGLAVMATVIGMAAFLAGVLLLARRPHWWQGYAAATIAIVLAAGASLVPLAIGVRRGPGAMVQMFMVSTASRGAVALGVTALAVGVGKYPAMPTFAMLIPYYLALLAVEAACLARAARAGR